MGVSESNSNRSLHYLRVTVGHANVIVVRLGHHYISCLCHRRPFSYHVCPPLLPPFEISWFLCCLRFPRAHVNRALGSKLMLAQDSIAAIVGSQPATPT